MKKFEKISTINCKIEELFQFHTDMRNLVNITPPDTKVNLINKDFVPHEGGVLKIKTVKNFIPTNWEVKIDKMQEPSLLIDIAIKSPFKYWKHSHVFTQKGNICELKDIVDSQMVVSRADPKFLIELFKLEVPEIESGVLEIMAIAREAGSRSKMAVNSTQDGVDPIGSCVGQRGIRIANVMNELGEEKIDIIEWDEDPEVFVANALSPAKIEEVTIEDETATVIVEDDQLSLAIGRDGQNVRLAWKLSGYKIDIVGSGGEVVKEEDLEEIKEDLEKEDDDEEGDEVKGKKKETKEEKKEKKEEKEKEKEIEKKEENEVKGEESKEEKPEEADEEEK